MSRVATVGTFDGLHCGHRAIIARAAALAGERPPLVVTFDRHPLNVIAPERAPRLIYSRDGLPGRIADLGGEALVLPATPALLGMTAVQFMAMLHGSHGVGRLVMGPDNTFGSDRLTDRTQYAAAGAAAGVAVEWIEPCLCGGERPSSSALRRAIAGGDTAAATLLWGRPLAVTGPVVTGRQNGRRIGVPTVNIAWSEPWVAMLPAGVYAGFLSTGADCRPAVINIGNNPTVGDGNPRTVEAHVPGHDLGDLTGHTVTATIGRYLRPERRFASMDELRQAIQNDIRQL